MADDTHLDTERAQQLTGSVVGTIVAAGVLSVSSADEQPDISDTVAYLIATVAIFWLAHGWAYSLGRRATGHGRSRMRDGLKHELPVVESLLFPTAALVIAGLLGASEETALSIGVWVCVAELGLLGVAISFREGASPLGYIRTVGGCVALGLVMIGLKATFH